MPLAHKLSIILLYFSAAVSMNDALVPLSLYVALPLSFFLSFYHNPFSSPFQNRYFKLLIILYVWCAFTAVTAIDLKLVSRQFNQILGVILLSSIIINLCRNKKCLPWLYGLYIILSLSIFQYVMENIYTIKYDVSNSRIGDEKLDPNTIAYYTFFVTCALYILAKLPINRMIQKVFSISFLLMIPVSFWIAIYTASRQVLLIQTPLISLLIFLKYFYGQKHAMRSIIITAVIATLVILYFSNDIAFIYDNSFLKQRSERVVEDDPRMALIYQAIDVGMANPILGVGPGNFSILQPDHQFSHCSFTELFANSGFPALALYVYILFSFIFRQYKNYRRYKDTMFLVFLSIGVIFVFYNFFYVFYIDLWLMSFFALITTHAIILQKQHNRIKESDRRISVNPISV